MLNWQYEYSLSTKFKQWDFPRLDDGLYLFTQIIGSRFFNEILALLQKGQNEGIYSPLAKLNRAAN